MTEIKLANWNFANNKIRFGQENQGFVGGDTLAVFAVSAPYYTDMGLDVASQEIVGAKTSPNSLFDEAVALAMIQDLSIMQQANMVRVGELGTIAKYSIRSVRAEGNGSMSQVFMNGPSLLASLYKNMGASSSFVADSPRDLPGYQDSAGDAIVMNLGSSLFANPTGLVVVAYSNTKKAVTAWFFEEVMIPQFQFAFSASNPVTMQGLSFTFSAMIPLPIADRNAKFTMNTIAVPG